MNDHSKAFQWRWIALGLLVMMALGLIGLAALGNITAKDVSPSDSSYAALILLVFTFVGIGGITVLLIGLATILGFQKLADHPHALGLPKGSVRAVLALSLVVAFFATSVYLLGITDLNRGAPTIREVKLKDTGEIDKLKATLGTECAVFEQKPTPGAADTPYTVQVVCPGTGSARVDLAKQIFTTIATVLVTVIGFYFGSRASTRPAEEEAANSLVAGERMAAETTLGSFIDAADKLIAEVEKSATRADKAQTAAQANTKSAPQKIRSVMQADLVRVQNASIQAHEALDGARTLRDKLKQLWPPPEPADQTPARLAAAARSLQEAMAELKKFAERAASAAAKAEKIVARGTALLARSA